MRKRKSTPKLLIFRKGIFKSAHHTQRNTNTLTVFLQVEGPKLMNCFDEQYSCPATDLKIPKSTLAQIFKISLFQFGQKPSMDGSSMFN